MSAERERRYVVRSSYDMALSTSVSREWRLRASDGALGSGRTNLGSSGPGPPSLYPVPRRTYEPSVGRGSRPPVRGGEG